MYLPVIVLVTLMTNYYYNNLELEAEPQHFLLKMKQDTT
jgi:hypothetical protein